MLNNKLDYVNQYIIIYFNNNRAKFHPDLIQNDNSVFFTLDTWLMVICVNLFPLFRLFLKTVFPKSKQQQDE